MGAGILMLFTLCFDTFTLTDAHEWQENPQFKPWRIGASSPDQWQKPGPRALACLGTTLEISQDNWPRISRRTIPWRSIMKIGGDDWNRERPQVEMANFGQIAIADLPPQEVRISEMDWSYGLVECSSETGKKLRIWMSRTSPVVLSRTDSENISFFTGEGAPGPRFCAYESNGEARVIQVEENEELELPSGSWLLLWFGNAFTSSRFSPYVVCPYPADCPLLFFFQNAPETISFGNGMKLTFKPDEGAGYVAMLPIFGDSYPLALPEDDKLLDSLPSVRFDHGNVPDEFKQYFYPSGFETASWSQQLPESVVETCRWWAEHLHRIPVAARESYTYDIASDTLTIKESLKFLQMKESGKALAPIPPMLAIAKEEGFPVEFDYPLVKTSVLTAHGPFAGFEDVEEYTWRISGLSRYVIANRNAERSDGAPEDVYDELESEVRKIIDAGELAPWYPVMDDNGAGYMGYYDRGYRGHFLFSNPAETTYYLAEAYPFLKPETQQMVVRYLKGILSRHPAEKLDLLLMGQGAPRERYRPTPTSIISRLNTHFQQSNFYLQSGIPPEKNLYYLARYYELTGDTPDLEENWQQVLSMLSPYLATLDWGTMGFRRRLTTWAGRAGLGGVIDTNSLFAALAGGIRLAKMAGDRDSEQMLWGVFGKIAVLRFAMGKYYSFLSKYGLLQIPEKPDWMRQALAGSWRGYLYTANWTKPEDDIQQIWQMDQFGICYREDRFRAWPGLMTFIEPTPELGIFFKDHLLIESQALMRRINEVMPAWWTIYCPCEHTWETSFQPPEDSHQLFMLCAWVLDETPERLAWIRNVPWLERGDLFYIHKLAETIRAYQSSCEG